MSQATGGTGPADVARLYLLAEALAAEVRRHGISDRDLDTASRGKEPDPDTVAELARGRRREAGLFALVDVARTLAEVHDLERLLKAVTRRARALLRMDMAAAALRDEKGVLRIRVCDGHVSPHTVGLRVPEKVGLGSRARAISAPTWTPDHPSDERVPRDGTIERVVRAEGLRAIMAVPLSQGAQSLGTLYVASRNVRHFTADEVALMGSLGDLAGAAVEKAQLLERVTGRVSALERRAAAAEERLRDALEHAEAQRRLLELALDTGDPHALAREAGERLGGPVRITAPDGTVLASAGPAPQDETPPAPPANPGNPPTPSPPPTASPDAARSEEEPTGILTAPIHAEGRTLGRVLFHPRGARPPFTERERALLSAVARTAAVLLLPKAPGALGESRDEWFERLLDEPRRPRERPGHRHRRFGPAEDRPYVVVVARPEGGSRKRAAAWARGYARRANGFLNPREGGTVLLLPGTDAGAAAGTVVEELSALLGHPVTAGAAGPVTDPATVPDAHREARRCQAVLTALGLTGRAASACELGFIGLLLSHDYDAAAFVDSAIGPVTAYDSEHLAELVPTLEAYFRTGCSPTHAAKHLHVHPNTVSRRLERITRLLGDDWLNAERSLEIHLAVRLHRVLPALHTDAPDPAR